MLIIIIYVYLHELCGAFSGSLKNVHACFRVTCHHTVGLRNVMVCMRTMKILSCLPHYFMFVYDFLGMFQTLC